MVELGQEALGEGPPEVTEPDALGLVEVMVMLVLMMVVVMWWCAGLDHGDDRMLQKKDFKETDYYEKKENERKEETWLEMIKEKSSILEANWMIEETEYCKKKD